MHGLHVGFIRPNDKDYQRRVYTLQVTPVTKYTANGYNNSLRCSLTILHSCSFKGVFHIKWMVILSARLIMLCELCLLVCGVDLQLKPTVKILMWQQVLIIANTCFSWKPKCAMWWIECRRAPFFVLWETSASQTHVVFLWVVCLILKKLPI